MSESLLQPPSDVVDHLFAAQLVQGLVQHLGVNQQRLVRTAQPLEKLSRGHRVDDGVLAPEQEQNRCVNFTGPCHDHLATLDHSEEEAGAHAAVAERVGAMFFLDHRVAGQKVRAEVAGQGQPGAQTLRARATSSLLLGTGNTSLKAGFETTIPAIELRFRSASRNATCPPLE